MISATETPVGSKEELNDETLAAAWKVFINSLKDEGPRIISMFKSIMPEVEDNHTVRIHLSNAAQKDLFVTELQTKACFLY